MRSDPKATDPSKSRAGTRSRSLARFFTEQAPGLRRYLARFVGRAEAEDLAQEAFVRLYDAASPVRSPRGLLFKTARNLALNHEKRRKIASAFLVGDIDTHITADETPSAEDQVIWREDLQLLEAALQTLSPKCRAVFLLRKIEGLSYREIASRVGITPLAVEKHVGRAYKICTEYLIRAQDKKAGSASHGARKHG